MLACGRGAADTDSSPGRGTMRLWTGMFLALALAASHARAFTYVPMTDAALIADGERVVHGTVEGVDAGASSGSEVVYILRPEGQQAQKERLLVRVPGAHPTATEGFFVAGAPHFEPGEEVVLVLGAADQQGVHGLAQFALGAFRVVDSLQGKALVRDLSAGHALGNNKSVPDGPRSLRGFLDYADAVRAGAVPADPDAYFIPESSLIRAATVNFTTFENGSGNPLRWRFDQGLTATYRRNGGAAFEPQLIAALDAFANAPDTEIATAFGGTTNFEGGTCEGRSAGVNGVLFGDPLNEIDGSFNCSRGGTLGIGGPCFGGSHTYNDSSYGTILAGRVVIQDGAECWMERNGGQNAAELLGHELGHSLGLAHSCADADSGPCDDDPVGDNDALMRARAHGDGRGASLGVDDLAALVFLYGVGSYTLNVATTGTGIGSVASDPAGISCPGDCAEDYATGTEVTLTATPASGSVFAGWSGDCSGPAATTAVTLSATRRCTARFNSDPASIILRDDFEP
mgnify:CR=1 FL=1